VGEMPTVMRANEPAFPVFKGPMAFSDRGITRLEYFAAASLRSIRWEMFEEDGTDVQAVIARECFDMAEKMLREAERRGI